MYQGQSRERFENNNAKLRAHHARHVRAEGGGLVLRPSLVALLVSAAVAVMAVSPGDALAQHAPASETRQSFSIPAQPLINALKAFGRQTQMQVLFDDALVEGRQGAAVSGHLTARQAMAQLLVGTGLVAISTQPGTFTLRAAPVAAPTATMATVTVAAQADRETATGPVRGLIAKRSATASKTDTPLIETPQSISVIPAEQMELLKPRDVAEALTYTAGINRAAWVDRVSDQFVVRGFTSTQPY